MLANKTFPFNRLLFFFAIAALAIVALHLFSNQVISRIPTMAPMLFPVLTIFLLVFHLLIAGFMLMKYLCDKHRLYLMAIACAFSGSALLMTGTLSSHVNGMLNTSFDSINYNDALIYYFFRNVMMATLFIAASFLYKYRHSDIHTRRNHTFVLSALIGFTVAILTLSWLYSSHYDGLSFSLIDNPTKLFTPIWHNYIITGMIVLWCIALVIMLYITRLKNIFWYSGYLFCTFYIFTLFLLLHTVSVADFVWYQSRLFETTATLFLIFVLLFDVFTLYRESNSKYENSYQNSIRDPMTRLFNRSFFYDSLKSHMEKVSPSSPVSVIVCDLDHFKRINDNYGHLQGDKVIQFVAAILQEALRVNDIAARIGGEEFALLLTNTDAENALRIAERIRQTVCQHDEESSHGHLPEKITISMGVFTSTQKQAELEVCVQRADEAMYLAKKQGRNRVVVWQP